jgi:hypothetical protein
MRKYLIISAVTLVAASFTMLGVGMASASTTDVLTYGSAGGTNVAVNSGLQSSLSSGTDATFYTTTTGTTGGSCSSGNMSSTLTANPAEGGTASQSVTSQAFTTCTDSLGYTSLGVTITTPYTATTTSGGLGVATLHATIIGTNPGCDGVCSGSSAKRANTICPQTAHGQVTGGCGSTTTCDYTGTGLSGIHGRQCVRTGRTSQLPAQSGT